ncbi:thioredoxin-like protein [Coemansia reversa NRRL 1564]|uniref:Thioredoxin-like protein n=1 Tax=Coemansia reversa (strain ATCC 12441 / NRRL 1564) TaxID=763665 RepID=A0A2G5BAK6_COERN|nr:thioredoxin-like protein [Coemansia reversa NRRL 1564]|eukprot:PIA16048.1 thioredoxin-like protein [Coemansia reversa NRRL 1564]
MSTTAYPYNEGGYTLYFDPCCPFAQRAARALNAAKVPYSIEKIDLENKPSWFHLVNPQLKVPALRTPGGTVFIESLVIAEYVADQFPEARLLPSDAIERAQLRLFIDLFGKRFFPNIYKILDSTDKANENKFKQELLDGIRDIGKELEIQWSRRSGKGGPFWNGDKWGYVEIVLSSFIGNLVPLKHCTAFTVPDTEEFASFNRWRKAIEAAPGFLEIKPDDKLLINAFERYIAGVSK